MRHCLTMFPENWNHPKIKTRLFALCLFRRDKLPRQVHPAEMIIRGKPLEHLWAPAPHCVRLSSLIDTNLSATPPLLFCRSCSVPLCQTAEQNFSGKRSYLDITLKIKSSSGDSVSLPKHHLAETGEDTAWHTPPIPHPINPPFPPTVFAHAQKGRTDGCRFGRGLFPSDLPILICMRRALSRLA